MSGSAGSPRSNAKRAASVQRLKAAVAERKQARARREAGKRTSVQIEAAAPRKSAVAVRKRDAS